MIEYIKFWLAAFAVDCAVFFGLMALVGGLYALDWFRYYRRKK